MALIIHLVLLCYQITPVIVITVAIFWTNLSNGLNAPDTFTALAFVIMTALPMAKLLDAYPKFMSSLGCFQRIETYLLLEERQDGRAIIESHNDHSSGKDGSEVDPSNCPVLPTSQLPIELHPPQSPIVFLDASIAAAGKQPILKSVNFVAMRSKLTIILGRTGSGKSTLLRAILGEAILIDGCIYIEQRQIGYCDQNPWLRDISIRGNIIGDKAYDKDWYKAVLDSCLLSDDIQQLPNGDETMSGNGGSNLSGGQKQRIVSREPLYVVLRLIRPFKGPRQSRLLPGFYFGLRQRI